MACLLLGAGAVGSAVRVTLVKMKFFEHAFEGVGDSFAEWPAADNQE